jgi:hypothetical protein
MNDPFFEECECDNNFSSDTHWLTAYDTQQQLDKEADAASILTLYK